MYVFFWPRSRSSESALNPASLIILVLLRGWPVSADSKSEPAPTSTSGYFAALNDLATATPYQPVGGQNFTRCCLQAVQDWVNGDSDVSIQWGDFTPNPNYVFSGPDSLSSSGAQFPCGASFEGNITGAPEVVVKYSWCTSNCGGWQISNNGDLAQWVIPLVGFILPAAVFCLNVPRKMIFNIGDSLFPDVINEFRNNWQNLWLYILGKRGDRSALGFTSRCLRTLLNTISGIAQLVFRAVVALSLGLINVIVWVIVVFSTASPMILSGLYEAAIDRQVLSAIEREIRHYQSLRKRTGGSYATNELYRIRYQVHLLYAILVGNLELWEKPDDTISDTTTPSSPVDISQNGSGAHPPPPNFKDESTIDQPRVPQPTSEAWKHVSEILDKMDTGSPTHRFNAQTRLNTMLECQASFGATIGAPIAFFLGAFLLSVESNVNQYGDNDDSHALAFGEWWMTIPHVAIVSGCLLAGNNPNTLEAIYSGVRDTFDALRGHHDNEKTFRSTGAVEGDSSDHLAGDVHSSGPRRIPPALERLWDNIYKPFYNSHYQPVWMWERGRSKRNWIQAVQEIKAYESAKFGTGGEPSRLRRASTLSRQSSRAQKILAKLRELWYISRIQHRLQDVPSLGLIGWAFLVFEAIIIIIIPCVLAFITSYFTPAVGLSCRTLTFVIYFAFQFWLTCLWAIDFENIVHSRLYAGKSGCPSVFSIAIVFGFCGSAFCAVAGTIMQIMGVYRNCKCNIPLSAWASGDFSFAISSNSAAMIYYAKRYWLATGVASIAQLLAFCYSGWWYQRHWRQRFNKVVKDVLDVRDVLANGDRHDRGKIVNGHKKELAGGNAVDKALENKEAMTPVTTGRERNAVDDMSIEPA